MIEQETVAELTPSKGLSTSGERRAAPDFQLLFESAPGLLLVLEPDAPRYTIVAVSDAYARATMRTREEILGRGLFEVWPADPASPETTGVSQTAASLERVLGGRATDVMALQRHDLHRPDGGARVVRYWSVLNAPVLGRDGRLLYIIHAVEDVTGRIEAARAGLAAQDWSAELRLHVARTESDIVERGQRLAALKEGLARAEEELSILHERAMQLDALRARYSPEVGLEALRLSEARLSGIVDGSPDAIVSVEEGRITRFNDSAESMFGYHRDEVLGAPLDVLLPERFRAKHHQHLEAFGAGAQNGRRLSPRRATIFGRRKNGEEFPIDASLSKLEILGTVVLTVTARDVSERSRHEDEQRRLAEAGRS